MTTRWPFESGRSGGGRDLRQAAFTMVEIALSLGIIAFALVAIIGVLPTGMKVQKENREETVISQDGLYFLEGIRSGARGVEQLTNYVESITIQSSPPGPPRRVYTNNVVSPGGYIPLTNNAQVIGLLSTPRIEPVYSAQGVWVGLKTNIVTARVKAITGVASEKSRLNDEMALRYQLRSEIAAFTNLPVPLLTATTNDLIKSTNLLHNLYEVRLTVSWPLYEHGDTWELGSGRRTFRTLVSGELKVLTNQSGVYHFFDPYTFTSRN